MRILKLASLLMVFFALTVVSAEQWHPEANAEWDDIVEGNEDLLFRPFACKKATASQMFKVNQGNARTAEFLNQCSIATNGSPWCDQIVRPNPSSIDIFRCTYGPSQIHQLIHPDQRSWKNAFQAINLVEALEGKGIRTCLIYNWWRPEPYNGNVGGAEGRHPHATSVDIRFCTMNDMENAFAQLCQWRKQGKIRAIGYYGSTGLHFGIGDSQGNTWGKSCPP